MPENFRLYRGRLPLTAVGQCVLSDSRRAVCEHHAYHATLTGVASTETIEHELDKGPHPAHPLYGALNTESAIWQKFLLP